MLNAYSVQITFGRAVTIFRARNMIPIEEMYTLLQLRAYGKRDWHLLMGPNEGSPVMAMLDFGFATNREFGVASEEDEVMERARAFAEELYEFTPENYDRVAEKHWCT